MTSLEFTIKKIGDFFFEICLYFEELPLFC